MPSVVRGTQWFVRCDGTKEFLSQKLAILGLQVTFALATYHVGEGKENPHCHILITIEKELQKQSFDVKVKNIFGYTTGDKNYSSKPWDGRVVEEGAASYLFHESLDAPILIQKGVSAEEIKQIKALAKVVNKVVEANRQKAETKIPGKVIEKWIANGEKYWNDKDIVKCICEMARDGECYLPKTDWMWKAYVEEIKLKMCKTPDQFEDFAQGTYLRLFCR